MLSKILRQPELRFNREIRIEYKETLERYRIARCIEVKKLFFKNHKNEAQNSFTQILHHSL